MTAIAPTPDSQPSSPTPTLTVAPTPTPQPPPTPRPTLRVNGLAQVAINNLVQVLAPEINDPRNQIRLAVGSLDIGEIVFVVDRREFAGRPHWELGRVSSRPELPLGWVPELADNGLPTLFPYDPDCPDGEELTPQALVDLGGLAALACFGNKELSLAGRVHCDAGSIDWTISGPTWLSETVVCGMDDEFRLNGPAATSLLDLPVPNDRYRVRGHFDDPESIRCGWILFGTSGMSPKDPGEHGPVFTCRQLFVVTHVEQIP